MRTQFTIQDSKPKKRSQEDKENLRRQSQKKLI